MVHNGIAGRYKQYISPSLFYPLATVLFQNFLGQVGLEYYSTVLASCLLLL